MVREHSIAPISDKINCLYGRMVIAVWFAMGRGSAITKCVR